MREKKSFIMTASVAIFLAMTSCNTEKKNESADAAQEPVVAKVETVQNASDFTFKDEGVKIAFQHYTMLRTALTKSNASEASKSAEMLVGALNNSTSSASANEAAKVIAKSADLKEQRIAFSALSEAMIVLVSSNITSGAVYLAHCPMAMNNEGANWITKTEEIMNPYFGDMMLKCGSITQTIASAE
jgi:predicted S18 family serine protease